MKVCVESNTDTGLTYFMKINNMKKQLISFELAVLIKALNFNEDCLYFYNNHANKKEVTLETNIITEDKCCNSNSGGCDYCACYDVFNTNGELSSYEFSAPTLTEVQTWLRDNYNCFVEVNMHSPIDETPITKTNLRFFVEVNYYGQNFDLILSDEEDFSEIDFKSYEEALELGLQEALKLIK